MNITDYDGVLTKPELNDESFSEAGIIQHGWLKNAAAKAHKYIERWKGKNGKWYYKYKSKALESVTKFANKTVGINDPRSVVNNKKPVEYWFPLLGSSRGRNVVWTDNGKANSRRGQTGSRVKQGTVAGRKRVKKAATTKKFNQQMNKKAFPTTNGGWYTKEYSQNFRTNNRDTKKLNPKLEVTKSGTSKVTNKTKAQGYNSSVGSVTNNKATNNAVRAMENKNRIKSQSVHNVDTFNAITGQWTKKRVTKKTRAKKNAEARRK